MTAAADRARSGVLLAGGAFVVWGFLAAYYKFLGNVPVVDILAHRGVWALVFLAGLVTAFGRWKHVKAALANRRVLLVLITTALLISSNWFGFIYTVNSNQVLAASLAYFINPLMNVAIGVLFLSERLSPAQKLAIGLAGLGVANQIIVIGAVPWISLYLAASFAAYGYLRKTVAVESLDGLLIEMAVVLPIMVGWLAWHYGPAMGVADHDTPTILLLLLTGPFTAIPLLLFGAGARRIHMATLGILQFIAPSIMFLLAVGVYGEPFGIANALTFGGIWAGLAVFSWDAWRASRVPVNT